MTLAEAIVSCSLVGALLVNLVLVGAWGRKR